MKTFTLAILPLALISAFSHAAEEKAAEQAEVDLAFVAALTRRCIAGQVDTRHGADKFGNIVDGRTLVDIVFRNTRYAKRLLQLLLSSNVNGIDFSLFNCFLFSCV